MNDGIGAAELMAFNNNNSQWMNNPFIYLVWLALLGGNGIFGGNNAANGAATRSDIYDGFSYNQLDNGIRNLQSTVSDGFYGSNTALLQGLNGIGKDLCNGFHSTESAIANLGFAQKDCCCQTNRNIDSVRYDMSRGIGEIINSANLNTRDIIESQTRGTQRILDKLNDQEIYQLRSDLQTSQLELSNLNQTKDIIQAVRPFPEPAYITCSPYTTPCLPPEAFFRNK